VTAAIINQPQVVREELIWLIRQRMGQHPRSQQLTIGASEIGDPCPRNLALKLARPAAGSTSWLAQIGVCVHAWLEDTANRFNQQFQEPRFLVEQEVTVGRLAGRDVTGHVDLFDVDTSTIVDWKVVGAKRLDMFKANGPGPQYRGQAHLYGRGLVGLGHHVRQVMIAFLPRERDLSSAWFWAEPYDESIAIQALSRAQGLVDLIACWGIDQVLAAYPPCGVHYCQACKPAFFS
jgi:hypothetical protein